ncbi:ankyrin repeat-containing domain protein [Podospora aff. communis PSN243]|uniref:Ankyrin repeat-containing domain protein n=1 Tax=Podospora aff. communis PSN243 TaxID=3040156 RepID=A0AAV9GDU9_9PEZI|nr:ankyrin repeat-containing domain protein [Podospora aff. communis PSN243]
MVAFSFLAVSGIVAISLANLVQALGGPQDWNDFSNNFATDLAPILVLFGEQASKQFLSESTSIWDCLIFGIAPIGVITAVVSTIRLYGSSSLKAFIGRAQEAHGVAEAELCSSTSDDVCELWSNGGICRVFGRPLILEFFRIHPRADDFYPRFDGPVVDTTIPPSCGLHQPKIVLSAVRKLPIERESDARSHLTTGWVEVDSSGHSAIRDAGSEEDGTPHGFAPHPNLSLNIGIKPLSRRLLRAIAAIGTLLQLSFFGYATWVTFYYPELYDEDGLPSLWSFCLATAGTAILACGMICCAMLIENMSAERRFQHKTNEAETTMFWLQPGDQRVGDQLFNAFAYSKSGDTYITSWKTDAAVESQRSGLSRLTRTRFRLGLAIGSSCCGFLCQFVGLRGLHGSVALYQLAITLCMAIVRALLRSRRLGANRNRLKQRRNIEGHELDWQALNIERTSDGEFKGGWYIDDFPSPLRRPSDTGCAPDEKPDTLMPDRGVEQAPGTHRLAGFHVQKQRDIDRVQSARTAVAWIKENESDGSQPNEAARIFHYRASLACLTGSLIDAEEERWGTKTREVARQLQEAMQEATEYIFSDMAILKGWRESSSLVWSTTCRLHEPPTPPTGGGSAGASTSFPIHFAMHCSAGRWEISECQLEAALGLWSWSVRQLAPRILDRVSRRKAFMAMRHEKRDDLVSAIRLWVTQSHDITTDRVKLPQAAVADPGILPSGRGPVDDHLGNDRYGYFPTTLSVPLMMLASPSLDDRQSASQTLAESQQDEERLDGVCLSIKSQSSLLQLIAQDIFGIFISRIADIMDPLNAAEPWTRRSQISGFSGGDATDQSYLGLANPHVRALADIMVSSGIGTREDALMTLIPPLLQRAKLPSTSEVMDALLHVAKDLRRKDKLSQAENLLRWLIDNVPRELQERAVRALGNLYRNALRSSDPSDQHFGHVGFEAMSDMKTLSEGRQIFDETDRAIKGYLSAWDSLKATGRKEKSSLEQLITKLNNTKNGTPTLYSALCAIDALDLRGARSTDAMKLLNRAISARCPELIEDMWSSNHIRVLIAASRLTEPNTAEEPAPLFWAIDCEVDSETLEALLDWPDLDLARNGIGPLTAASQKGNYLAVDILLRRGVRPHGEGGLALLLAVEGRHGRVVHRLLSVGTDHTEVQYLTRALHSAIGWDNEVVKSLLKHQADPHEELSGQNALHVAVQRADTSAAQELLRHGADVNKGDRKGTHPPLMAVQLGHFAILELFMPILSQSTIAQLLSPAVESGNKSIVDLLLRNHEAKRERVARITGQTPLLTMAVEKGLEEIVEALLEAHADPNMLVANHDNSPLHAAIRANNKRLVTTILNPRYGADVNLQIRSGQTPLALAVELGQHETAEQLLERNAAPDADLGERGTALHLATERKDHQMVDLLLRGGANLNTKDGQGRTPLLAALEGEATQHDPINEKIAERLLNALAGPNERNSANTNGPLHAAVRTGNERILSKILDPCYRADLDLTVNGWQTPLALAVELNQRHSIELLLKRGASPNAKHQRVGDAEFGTVLHLATKRRHGEVVDMLITAGADIEKTDGEGRTPLILALELAAAGHHQEYEKILEVLLHAGADVNTVVEQEGKASTVHSALHLAVQSDSPRMVKLLTEPEHRANMEVRNASGLTPLLAIVTPCRRLTQHQREIVRLLLGAGADINATGGKYGNVLQAAAHHGGEFFVYELLQHELKVDINAQGGYYGSALQAAVMARDGEEVVELLLDHEADPSAQGGAYGSALLAAVTEGRKKVAEILLRRGAETEARHSETGLTALLAAVKQGDIDMVSLLVQHKANLESTDREGRTALLMAAGNWNRKVVEILLNAGANKEAREPGSERTPMLVASDEGDYGMVRLLLEWGADINAEGGIYGNAMRAALYREDGEAEEMLRSFGGRAWPESG